MIYKNILLEHRDPIVFISVAFVLFFGMAGGIYVLQDWNDTAYFKTLDKLSCEEIWILMTVNTFDWDTVDYYGDRC